MHTVHSIRFSWKCFQCSTFGQKSSCFLCTEYSNTWCEWPKRGLLWTRKRSKKTSSSREGFSFVEKKKWKTLNAFFLECQASDQIRFLDWALLDITDVVFVCSSSSIFILILRQRFYSNALTNFPESCSRSLQLSNSRCTFKYQRRKKASSKA